MKGTDKYLVGIAAGIVLLVVVTVIVVLTRPKPEYRSDDSPEATVHNYLLALKEGNYERAHSYLSPNLESYPEDAQAFAKDLRDHPWRFGQEEDSALAIDSSRVTGDSATVDVNETDYYSGGLFDSRQITRRFEMVLRRENNMWKLVYADRYWDGCWSDDNASWCG